MMGLRETLEAATPGPWSKSQRWMAVGHAGRDIGICSTWGENGHANARLAALAPELASLVLDMGEALRRVSDCPNESAPYHSGCSFCAAMEEMGVYALLARLDQLGKEQT